MKKIVSLVLAVFLVFSSFSLGEVQASGHVTDLDTGLISSGHGGQIIVTAADGYKFDDGTEVILQFYYNGKLYAADPIVTNTNKQLIVYIPPTDDFADSGNTGAPVYTGVANLIIDKIKTIPDNSVISDTLQFNFVKDPVIKDVYQNVETTFTKDGSGNITDTKEVRQLVIEGENFDLKELMIGGSDGVGGLSSAKGEVKILSKGSMRIVAEVPDQIINDGHTAHDVSIRNGNNGLAVYNGFIFNELSHIQNIDKSRAYPGDKLSITGTNLPKDRNEISKIIIANQEVPNDGDHIKITSGKLPDTIQVTVPEAGDRNNKDISIRRNMTGGDVQVTLKNQFTVVYTPAGLSIDRIEPNSGTTDGGTDIKIYGSGFVQGMQVYIGGYNKKNKAEVKSVSSDPNAEGKTIIKALTPSSDAEGAKDVYVLNPVDGSEVRKTGGFTYISVANALTIYPEQINPTEARETEEKPITIVGRNISNINVNSLLPMEGEDWYTDSKDRFFDNAAKEYVVHYKGMYQGQEAYIEKTIRLTIGNEAAIKSIGFQGNANDSNHSKDQLISAKTPIITLDPRVDTKADIAVNTYTVAGTLKGVQNKTPETGKRYDFGRVLFETSESAVIKNGFTYKPDPTDPQIKSVTPHVGSVKGGDEITIEGTDIRPGAKGYIGEETAKNMAQPVSINISVDGDIIKSTLVVRTPSSDMTGKKKIIVVNSEGSKVVSEDAYEYISVPHIDSITPSVGSKNDDIYISIEGSGFVVRTDDSGKPVLPKVWVGDQAITVNAVYDDKGNVVDGRRYKMGTKIKGRIPGGGTKTKGYADVKLVNPDYPSFDNVETYPEDYDKDVIASGGKAILEAAFKYTDPDTKYSMHIDGIEPERGPVEGGTTVKIAGGTFPKSVYVAIDGEEAKIKSITGNAITIITPPGTVGKKIVQVISLAAGDAEGAVATVKDGFEYTIMSTDPKITSIVPTHGGSGTKVWVNGSDFIMSVPLVDENNKPVMDENGDQVYSKQSNVIVGGRMLDREHDEVDVVSPSVISFIMPGVPDDKSPVAGSYDVYIENPDTAVSNKVKFNFQISDSSPVIKDINPAIGSSKGGTLVKIEGEDLRQNVEVYFGDLKGQITSFDEDKQIISVKTPSYSPGAVDVSVLNKDGGSAIAKEGFTYVKAASGPSITSVTPNKGSAFGGDLVTITGDDFRKDKNDGRIPEVYFGNRKSKDVKYVRYNMITAVTPPYDGSGAVDVTLANPDSGLAVLRSGFTYSQSKPKITSIIPSTIPVAGGYAEIQGSGFSMRVVSSGGKEVNPGSIVRIIDGEKNIDLTLNPGEDASKPNDYNIDVVSSGCIRIKIPPVSSSGEKKIQVINPDGGIAEGKITFIKPLTSPQIDRIDPARGSIKGGTPVYIYGSDFRQNANVYIGGKQATVKSVGEDGKLIRIYTPAANQSIAGIPQDVVVYNEGDNSATLKGAFTYLQTESNPVINSIEPGQGSTLGNEKVIIKGDGFMGDVQVYFDNIGALKVKRIDYTTLEVTTPAHAVGKADVIVRNIDAYGEAVLKDGFEFIQTKPEDPTGFTAVGVSGDTIRLSWDKVEGADYYMLYGRKSNSDVYSFIASTEGSQYYVKGLDRDTRYYFRLDAVNFYGLSKSATASASTKNQWTDNGYDDTASRDQVNISGGSAIITLGLDESIYSFNLDLDPNKPTDIRINIPIYYVERSNRQVSIYSPKITAEFTIGELVGYDWGRARLHSRDYVIVEFKELKGSEYGSYSRFVGSGSKILSPLFKIDVKSNIAGKQSDIKYLHDFDMRLKFINSSRTKGLYKFNEDNRRWDRISMSPGQFSFIKNTGVYAVLGR